MIDQLAVKENGSAFLIAIAQNAFGFNVRDPFTGKVYFMGCFSPEDGVQEWFFWRGRTPKDLDGREK